MVDYDNDQKHKEVDNVVLKANGVNQNEINDKEHEIGWSEREVLWIVVPIRMTT